MSWEKRDPVTDLVVLGDDEGQVRTAGGLLASTKQDSMYPSRLNYELVQKDGSSRWLAGSASIGRQLSPSDVGRFIKAKFVGWGKSANGRFKEIEVMIWQGEPTDEMKDWPRWAEVNDSGQQDDEPPLDETQAAVYADDEDDSDLPF